MRGPVALQILLGTEYGELVKQANREQKPMRTPELSGRTIDVRGLLSPQPVLVLADEAERIGPGETIGILSDDPYSNEDFIRWCVSAGMDFIERKSLVDGTHRFVFRRPAVSWDPGIPPVRQWEHAA